MQHPLGHEVAGQDPALDDERGRRQGHPDRGDAAGRTVLRLVPDQPVAVVDLVEVVLDRQPLEGVQLVVTYGGLARWPRRRRSGSAHVPALPRSE